MNMTKISLIALFAGSMAFAADSYYLCSNGVGNSTLQLKQGSPCETWQTEAGTASSLEDLNASLKKMMKSSDEITAEDAATYFSTLELASDIDLDQIAADGSCKENHTPLYFADGTEFNGKDFTVKNLCYDNSSVTMDKPVGFFEEIGPKAGTVSNLKLDNVVIKVTKGTSVYPVGALAGRMESAYAGNITLTNVSIVSPFAGSLIGFMKNATVENIQIGDNVSISNEMTFVDMNANVTTQVLASEGIESPKQVYLGGVAGVAYRDEEHSTGEHETDASFKQITVKGISIENKNSEAVSALGGIVGMVVSSGTNGYERVNGAAIDGTISGGTLMGGLFGFGQSGVDASGYFERGKVQLYNNISFSGKIVNPQGKTEDISMGRYFGKDVSIQNISSLPAVEEYAITFMGGMDGSTPLGVYVVAKGSTIAEKDLPVVKDDLIEPEQMNRPAVDGVWRDEKGNGGDVVDLSKPLDKDVTLYASYYWLVRLLAEDENYYPMRISDWNGSQRDMFAKPGESIIDKLVLVEGNYEIKKIIRANNDISDSIKNVEKDMYSPMVELIYGKKSAKPPSQNALITLHWNLGTDEVSATEYAVGTAACSVGVPSKFNGAFTVGLDRYYFINWTTNKDDGGILSGKIPSTINRCQGLKDVSADAEYYAQFKVEHYVAFFFGKNPKNGNYSDEKGYLVQLSTKNTYHGGEISKDTLTKVYNVEMKENFIPDTNTQFCGWVTEQSEAISKKACSGTVEENLFKGVDLTVTSSVKYYAQYYEKQNSTPEDSDDDPQDNPKDDPKDDPNDSGNGSQDDSGDSGNDSKDDPADSDEPSKKDTVQVIKEPLEIASVLNQSGNAMRIEYVVKNASELFKTDVRLVITGNKGVLVDSVMVKAETDNGFKGAWEMYPLEAGHYSVSFVAENGEEKAASDGEFEIASEIQVNPMSWQMISLEALDKKSLKSEEAHIYWWDEENPIGEYWQYRAYEGGNTEATRGYWYESTSGKSLALGEALESKDAEITWKLDSLYSGWNMVANPYGWAMDLSSGKTDDGSKVTFWRWNSQKAEYEKSSEIGPYEAVWVKVDHPVEFKMSSKPLFQKKSSEGGALAKAVGQSGWTLKVVLKDEFGKQDSWNVLGQGAVAESLEEPPQGMGDRVNLSIMESRKALAKSVKAADEEASWTLAMNATTIRRGTLNFEGVEELAKQGLSLFVTLDGVTQEVKNEKGLNVLLKSSSQEVGVRVAKSGVVAVNNKVQDFKAYSVKAGVSAQFRLDKEYAGSLARVDLVTINGKVVAQKRFTAEAGSNTIMMENVKPGLYLVRVRVSGKTAVSRVNVF
ncbi:MAG: T9SS type A sorting domain-containing protein [Fibrobacteraceae bacterium]|nr:T9SS type A sorting domain-containing protein [Fibrobacteraceae bacterium]